MGDAPVLSTSQSQSHVRKAHELIYPSGLKHRESSSEATNDIESRLMGLPGSLSFDGQTAAKYFGQSAREAVGFFLHSFF